MAIILSSQRYEELKRISVKMLMQYEISSLPINVFELAYKIGIDVIPYSNIRLDRRWLLVKESEDGFSVQKQSGKWYIYYNNEKNVGRINYTIMHEIGHIVLDHSEDSELAEKEANIFAKYTLAPPVLIHKFNLKEPFGVSQLFNISYEAADYDYSYYQKWLRCYNGSFTDYEQSLISIFINP